MPKFHHLKRMPYSLKNLHALVQDVESYPQFLPWALGARIYDRQESHFFADLDIGYRLFRETYTSRVDLMPHQIKMTSVRGAFRFLNSNWTFTPLSDSETEVFFFIEFEFKSFVLGKMMNLFFEEAAHQMIHAFEERAQHLFR